MLIIRRSFRLPLHPLGGADNDSHIEWDPILGHSHIQRLGCYKMGRCERVKGEMNNNKGSVTNA
jgi:hypothetical protein